MTPAPLLADLRDHGNLPDAAPLLADPPRLRAHLAEHGVVLLRALLPPARVQAVRALIVGLLDEDGWLAGQDPLTARSDMPLEGDARHRALYRRLIHHPGFASLAQAPELLHAMRKLLAGEVLVHPRVIARLAPPHQPPTQPHQDFQYIRGTPDTLTAWIPLGDCPRTQGGLAVLPGSQRRGFIPHVRTSGAGGLGVPGLAGEAGWRSCDFVAGDVLVFPALTIHAALPNRSGAIRLSADFRYQRPDQAIDPDSRQPHLGLGPAA